MEKEINPPPQGAEPQVTVRVVSRLSSSSSSSSLQQTLKQASKTALDSEPSYSFNS